MNKLLLLLCISLSWMSIRSLRISKLAKKIISPHHHQAWAQWKEKYFPGEGDDTSCDNKKSMKQWEKNVEEINKHNENQKKGKSTFKEVCNEFCCKSSAEMAADRGAIIPKDVVKFFKELKRKYI